MGHNSSPVLYTYHGGKSPSDIEMAPSPTDIPFDTAALIAVIVESMLYGLSLPFFGSTLYALYVNRSTTRGTKSANWVMLGVCLTLFALSTAHLTLNVAHSFLCLIHSESPGGVACSDIKQPTFNVKNAVLGIAMTVADGITIYRVFVVWKNFWIIGVLGILWTGVAVCGTGTEIAVSQNMPLSSHVFQVQTKAWITSLWLSAFVCNASATACLAYRIWTISRSVHSIRVSKNRWWPFMRVVLDSAALYCTSLMATLIVFLCNSNAQFIALDMVSPIICICFYSIIIRVHLFSEQARISEIPGVTSDQQPNVRLRRIRVNVGQFIRNNVDVPISGKGTSTTDTLAVMVLPK